MQPTVTANSKMTMPSNLIAPPFKKATQVIPTEDSRTEASPGLTEFFFYLDAWTYCWKHNIPVQQIQRKSWKIWHLVK